MITFVEPSVITIRPGDTVESLARAHSVPMDQLMAWNGIPPEVPLAPGRTLLVFRLPPDEVLAALEARPSAEPVEAPTRRRPRSRARHATPVMRIDTEVVAVSDAPPPVPARPIQVDLDGIGPVERAGVLGGLDSLEDGMDGALADAAANLRHRRATGASDLGLRRTSSLAGGGSAESLNRVAELRVLGRPQEGVWGDHSTIRVPKLARPAPKRCLAGPTEADLRGDHAYVTAQGLNAAQVRAGMSRIIRHTLSCFPKGTRGTHRVTVEVTAGCDGTVTDVWLANSGGLPAPITSCITQTVYYASFPAHALPDGALFQYPILYRF